jgi:hypothetical protein
MRRTMEIPTPGRVNQEDASLSDHPSGCPLIPKWVGICSGSLGQAQKAKRTIQRTRSRFTLLKKALT